MPFTATWMGLEMIILNEVSQKEKRIPQDITHMWNLKNSKCICIQKQKQTHRHRKQTYGYQRGKGVGRDKLGVWDQQIQTSVYKIDKQGPTVQHRELYSISCNKP